jgi:glyoxylase-like metal-dependent hydrolase (beta-lactamase superfamily II)
VTSGWTQVGDRCYLRRYAEWDVNVTVVEAADGVLVVDTRGTQDQGRELHEHIRALTPSPIRWVVNTHVHFDHTFGNIAFDETQIWAHENVVASMDDNLAYMKALVAADDPDEDPLGAAVASTPLRYPDQTISSVAALDLGDRTVELVHPGRGHTDGDLLIKVPDADLLLAGDLIEESAAPSYGPDCWPLEWPGTLDLLVGSVATTSTIVPGHGRVVDRDFVESQRQFVSDVASTVREFVVARTPVDAAVNDTRWPSDDWPLSEPSRRQALLRGYAALGITPP